MFYLNCYLQTEIIMKLAFLLAGVAAINTKSLQFLSHSTDRKTSNYAIFSKSPLFHPEYYPLNQTVDPQLYKPVAEWSGRLILPPKQPQKEPFVKFEVQNAPTEHQQLIGKIVTLKWSHERKVQEYVHQVTVDVNFTEESKTKPGIFVYPLRLDKRYQVDPLESLAGARPIDDVCVKLSKPVVTTNENETELIIDSEPIQVTGRFVGLVRIEARKEATGDNFVVHHYNHTTKSFNGGVEEVIRIPQVLEDQRGIPRSTHTKIEQSPLNKQGWYIYGAPDATGTFVVQAIEPRALFRLQPQEVISHPDAVYEYIKNKMWADTANQKGQIQSVVLAPNTKTPEEAISQWKLGDKALVMHVFGGIGGKKAERKLMFFVPGHFAYGIAEVVRDSFTDELRFEIIYYQVYANNPDGFVAGAQTWATYMGSLWQGWLGNRPVSDILVKFPPITADYDFGEVTLSPLAVFTREVTEMMARYRVGDGTGTAHVSPAISCVQDSNQALYITIQRIEKIVESSPEILNYIQSHPETQQAQYFKSLVSLRDALEKQLTPFKVVRRDWEKNVKELSGIGANSNMISTMTRALSTWRTIFPRRAQDEIAEIFLQQGAIEWVLRTNQVGGFDPDILPVAPTTLLGGLFNG